jgi:hypothetical protein
MNFRLKAADVSADSAAVFIIEDIVQSLPSGIDDMAFSLNPLGQGVVWIFRSRCSSGVEGRCGDVSAVDRVAD